MTSFKKQCLTAHCLVRNEEKWVWYAINSVLEFVDKVLVYDTGSTDKTVEIIKSISNPKVILEQKGRVNKKQYTRLRQEMLERTKTFWFLILDGDEVWSRKSIKELRVSIDNAPQIKEAVVVPLWLCVGDIFHYDAFWAAHANFNHPQGVRSYMQIRAVRIVPGLKAVGEYGFEAYADRQDQNISDWNYERLIFLNEKYWHMSLLPRSRDLAHDREVMQRALKTRFIRGTPFPDGFKYPDVFKLARPSIVPSPWRRHTRIDTLKGLYYRSLNLISRKI